MSSLSDNFLWVFKNQVLLPDITSTPLLKMNSFTDIWQYFNQVFSYLFKIFKNCFKNYPVDTGLKLNVHKKLLT